MKNLKKVLAVLLALGMLFCFCACSGNDDGKTTTTTTTTESQPTENENPVESKGFTVAVVDENGNAVSGVMVQLCKDACVPAKTDDSGKATFSIEVTDGYKLSVMSCPEGYEYTGEAEVYLEDGTTEYTLEVKAVA